MNLFDPQAAGRRRYLSPPTKNMNHIAPSTVVRVKLKIFAYLQRQQKKESRQKASLIHPSFWALLSWSAFIMVVGSYSPGLDITGRLMYLKNQIKCIFCCDQTKELPFRGFYLKVSGFFNMYLWMWQAMSGRLRRSVPSCHENRKRMLKKMWIPYSGSTN